MLNRFIRLIGFPSHHVEAAENTPKPKVTYIALIEKFRLLLRNKINEGKKSKKGNRTREDNPKIVAHVAAELIVYENLQKQLKESGKRLRGMGAGQCISLAGRPREYVGCRACYYRKNGMDGGPKHTNIPGECVSRKVLKQK
jgi:hypothetical protein